MNVFEQIEQAATGASISDQEIRAVAAKAPFGALLTAAQNRRQIAHGNLVSFSPKVFLPLTQLCRDVCHYCTFAETPNKEQEAFLSPENILATVKKGKAAGCREVLFTLGDKPELRYRSVKKALERLGYGSTIEYLEAMCRLVVDSTGMLPHINAGIMTHKEIEALKCVSVSQGLMLESISDRLCEKGMPHFGSPDKDPAKRLAMIEAAGVLKVPFTSGILIGIGETRDERIEALLELRRIQQKFGHIQEIIIQNFRAKPGTKMHDRPEPELEDHLWTIAMARLIFDPKMSLQAPPNLWSQSYIRLLDAGINDWGGISPLTQDYVNPEAPWPNLEKLRNKTVNAGHSLVERLPIYPDYYFDADRWLDEKMHAPTHECADGAGYLRKDNWRAGRSVKIVEKKPAMPLPNISANSIILGALSKVLDQKPLNVQQIVSLFEARDNDFGTICNFADELRSEVSGDTVSYVVNRNINYTNICSYKCQFCAFSKGKTNKNLRGRPYDLNPDEITRRVQEAWNRGATEVCMQGGIHPDYSGATYLEIVKLAKRAAPDIHVHAFSPLEISHGAESMGISIKEFLTKLRAAGLGTLPGTAAEILDSRVRQILCPDKVGTKAWLNIIRTAHSLGLPTTATIMFGHVDSYADWARHLILIRDLQRETGGITEFVPLPFVAHEAPIYLRGKSRPGPTLREAVLMHAVARIVFHSHIPNIQASWTKMGPEGAKICLQAGVNDLGGTLMNESISRAAGAEHGQELTSNTINEVVNSIGRKAVQRTTLYTEVCQERIDTYRSAKPLNELLNNPARKKAKIGSLSSQYDLEK